MSNEIELLKYVGVYEEPFGSYQVDRSGVPGDFAPFPYKEGTLQANLGQAMLDPMTGKMRLDGHDQKVLGIKSNTFSLGTTLHSHGLDLDGDVDPPTSAQWALQRVLKAIMGGMVADGGIAAAGSQTTVQGGSTTTVVNVTAGHGDRFTAGGVIACQTVSGSSALEAREILSIATDAITVKQAFSAAPVAATPVRGGVTFYLTEDPQTSLQWLLEGREDNDGACLRGTQGGFALQLPIGELGTLTLNLAGAGWDLLSSAVTIPSYTRYQAFALAPLEVTVPTVGSSVRVVVPESALSIEPALAYAPVKSGAATHTIARMRRQPARPVIKGTFTAPKEDNTWWTARTNREVRALFAQGGNLAGGGFLVSLPTIQITDAQPAVSDAGIHGQLVTFEGRHDTAIGGSTELGYSALRVHFF